MSLLSLLVAMIKPKEHMNCGWSKTLTKFHFCIYGQINAGDDIEAMGYLDALLGTDDGTIVTPQILVKEDDA